MSSLTSENVRRIFMDCLFRQEELVGLKEGEKPEGMVESRGINVNIGFHPGRLDSYREEISLMCEELPPEFKEGWSFLNMCNDRHGALWTGLHQIMQELVLLGQAIGKIKLLSPREMWAALPGGMPYYQVAA